MASIFSASGLASGMDWNSMIDQLVALQSQPLTKLRDRQSAIRAQVSQIGDIASKLSSLRTAAENLSSDGVLAAKVSSTNTAFGVTPEAGAGAGRYTVQVTELAAAAKVRSQAFASGSAPVTGGTLALTVMNKAYSVEITDGMSLDDVAAAINLSDAPVSAVVLNDGTSSYLSITNDQTGYPLDADPSTALSVSMTTTGSQGQALTATSIQSATNASFTIDGLTFTRQSNTVTDAIPNVTMTLTKKGGPAEDLVLEYDSKETQTRLQTFVDAYNDVMKLVQRQLNVTETTNREVTLAGDTSIRGLQGQLQRLISSNVGLGGTVRSLADLGVQTARDGSLSIDSADLAAAIARNPGAVDALFSNATEGLAKAAKTLSERYTNSIDGLLTVRKNSLGKTVDALDDEAARIQVRIDNYRQSLVQQYTAMEETISGLKSIGNYLTSLDKKSTS